MRLKDLGEFNFIERVAKHIKASHRVIKGIGDDAAVISYKKGKYLLFTSDMMLEGTHFYRNAGGYLIGKKAINASISDIAAMGGLPKAALISLGVPGSLDVKYTDALYRGIRDAANRFNIDIGGGDTIESNKIIIDISLLGEVEKNHLLLRSNAKEGDGIFVTGAIGGTFRHKHLDFVPRLKEARFLAGNFRIHAAIDISDGLLSDLGHVLDASEAGALIFEKQIPVSKDAKDFDSAIRDGEDFELIFTMPQSEKERLIRTWPFKTRLSEIGEICGRHGGFNLAYKNGSVKKVRPEGFSHF